MSRYDDIIHLPHHVSQTHPQMSRESRAAQFSPFAALTGFGAVITETARRTERKIELDEHARQMLDERFRLIQAHLAEQPEASVTYYVEDGRKSGGAYVTVTGRVKKLDSLTQHVVLADGTSIPMDDVYAVDGVFLEEAEEYEDKSVFPGEEDPTAGP